MSPNILISGFYSGPSPSAGLGIARSLRQAWPKAKIIGIDYWDGASGLHDECLTERVVFPPWDLLDQSLHVETIKTYCEDHYVLSALDMEVAWLSQNVAPNQKLLSPTAEALRYAQKPFVKVGQFLPFKAPEIFLEAGDDQALYDFCREHSWRVWAKGPFHGAQFVQSWRELDAARRSLSINGSYSHVFYQSHVRGLEESICFSAVEGKLCGAVHMQKRVTTPDGKTWSGKVRPLSHRQRDVVSEAVRQMKWTGGGEFELIRDEADQYFLMEFNPRFPAWIYGSTIAGINLPALMVGEASGSAAPLPRGHITAEFTRIVMEIPVLSEIALPALAQPEHGQVSSVAKYGRTFSNLETELIRGGNLEGQAEHPQVSRGLAENDDLVDVRGLSLNQLETPARAYLSEKISERFEVAAAINSIADGSRKMRVAYSIKTCPDPVYLRQAHGTGLLAEAISMAEVEAALATGWNADQIILNGPAKWWPRSMSHHQGLAAVFSDSLDEFERMIASKRSDKVWGLRLNVPGFSSRFGVDLSSYDSLARAVSLIQRMPADIKLGFHVHMASNLIGKGHWQDAVESAMGWAMSISEQSCRPIHVFDLGGGHHPRDFGNIPWGEILTFAGSRIKGLETLVVEPGRALSQDTMVMVTSIQDIRRKHGEITDVVVDTCISELPLARVYPHRMYLATGDTLRPIAAGGARILGRICMEDDILADGVYLPRDARIGDRIVIADAGAYERSMSYEFGQGRISHAL